jgi:N6-adenosine-specific RNA methylase IME4
MSPLVIKQKRRAELEREVGARIASLPDKRHGVVYADSPWSFELYSRVTGMDRAAENHYPTLSLAGIKALERIAARAAALFGWITVPRVPAGLETMAAWGFAYKLNFAWVKDRLGTGYWFRNQHELLLIGTRASPRDAMAARDLGAGSTALAEAGCGP